MRKGSGILRVLCAAVGTGAVAALLLAQAATPSAAPTPTPPPAAAPAPHAATTPAHAAEGAAKAEAPPVCADCHGDIVAAFASNPHARYSLKDKKPDPNEVCSTCHGDGTKHMEAGGDPTLINTFHG